LRGQAREPKHDAQDRPGPELAQLFADQRPHHGSASRVARSRREHCKSGSSTSIAANTHEQAIGCDQRAERAQCRREHLERHEAAAAGLVVHQHHTDQCETAEQRGR
jgi:hypothetical protein